MRRPNEMPFVDMTKPRPRERRIDEPSLSRAARWRVLLGIGLLSWVVVFAFVWAA